jgi:hypothetical protein
MTTVNGLPFENTLEIIASMNQLPLSNGAGYTVTEITTKQNALYPANILTETQVSDILVLGSKKGVFKRTQVAPLELKYNNNTSMISGNYQNLPFIQSQPGYKDASYNIIPCGSCDYGKSQPYSMTNGNYTEGSSGNTAVCAPDLICS